MKGKIFCIAMFATLAAFAGGRDFLPLETARARPADFDAYWDGELARQRQEVPLASAKVEMVEIFDERVPKGYRLWDVTIPALSDVPVHGYLTVPVGAEPKSCVLYVRFGGAGTKSAPICRNPNTVSFSTNPNGCEQGRDEAYYKEFFNTIAKDYSQRGWYDREKCYFHGQILRVARALEWAKTRPEWNGRDLLVQGKSMGGSQALQAAAVDKDVTVCAPEDPAMCDHAGQLDEKHPRTSGWPRCLNYYRANRERGIMPGGYDEEKLLAVSDYYDNCFFASRIPDSCFVYFATGHCDGTCPSEGVFIAYMAKPGNRKLLTVDPKARHCQTNNIEFERHFKELRGGK